MGISGICCVAPTPSPTGGKKSGKKGGKKGGKKRGLQACPPAPPCDICGGPITNPDAVAQIDGFPPETCANANAVIANSACLANVTPEDACQLVAPLVSDICCVAPMPSPTGGNKSGKKGGNKSGKKGGKKSGKKGGKKSGKKGGKKGG